MTVPVQVPPPDTGCGMDVGCRAGQAALDGVTVDVAHGAADLLVTATTWWVRTGSVDPLAAAVTSAQDSLRGVVVLILMVSVLVQAIRLMLSRKGEPLILVATGLVRYAVVSALGLVLLSAALRAGDAVAVSVLDDAAGRFAELMRRVLVTAEAGFPVLVLSAATAVLALVQWLLMALRQAGLLVLAAMLPLAASGSLTRTTRGWLDRLLAWLVALVAYKPAAAFVYSIGFGYLSSPFAGQGGLGTMLTGLMVLVLAVIALPILLKFFAWSGGQIGGVGSGSAFIGALGAVGMARGGGRGAVEHAAAMDATGPGSQATAGQAPAGAAAAGGSGAGAAVFAAGAAAEGVSRAVDRVGEGMTGQDGDQR